MAPISHHEFFNLRTYVRYGEEDGIYFMSEWVPNRLSALLGPPLFGLPYRLGKHHYEHDFKGKNINGKLIASDPKGKFEYAAEIDADCNFQSCDEHSLENFLLERYTAFTAFGNRKRFFRVWHEPWLQTALKVEIKENTLLPQTGAWFEHSSLIGANYSEGLRDVWMGKPQNLQMIGKKR